MSVEKADAARSRALKEETSAVQGAVLAAWFRTLVMVPWED